MTETLFGKKFYAKNYRKLLRKKDLIFFRNAFSQKNMCAYCGNTYKKDFKPSYAIFGKLHSSIA